MATYNFSSIKVNSELEKVIMQLRLRQLPLNLDVINAIRIAIETPQLDERFHKTLEREFSGQWDEIQKKNHLAEWPKNQIGKELISNTPSVNLNTTTQPQNSQTSIPSPPKVFDIDIKHNIETMEQLRALLNRIKKAHKRGDYISKDTVKKILSFIKRSDIRLYFLDALNAMFTPSRNLTRKKNVPPKKPKRQGYSISVSPFIPERAPVIIERASDSSNLYEDFEYGLSDWDR